MAHAAPTEGNLPEFTNSIDLVSERLGGLPIHATDEFFAEKENLVKPGRGVFIADKYTDRGKWMDGWESRRKRTEGHDWCVIRMGLAGRISGFDIDTNFFLGNHPPFASVEALYSDRRLGPADDFAAMTWREILPKSPLNPGSRNFFAVNATERWNYLRLHIYPDGGVARFKVFGDVVPDLKALTSSDTIDLAAVENGGLVLGCNDAFFGPKDNLIMPGRGINMGDGWETRRKRQLPGFDWVILRLGVKGTARRILVDTNHFKGNYPDRCSIEGINAPGASFDDLKSRSDWKVIVPETKLQAHMIHEFSSGLQQVGPVTHIRMKIFPDGGVSRLRVFGNPDLT
jgi:allantoicase